MESCPRGVLMKRKNSKIVAGIFLVIIVVGCLFTYLYRAVIFQRGNPIPYVIKAVLLSEEEPYKKVFDDKEIYISKGREHFSKAEEGMIELVESKFGVTFVEQAGSSYLFQAENHRIIMSTELYLKYYNVWEISPEQTFDLIPMVMVKGKLYVDTGRESDIEARCGVMDGKITSTVEAFEKPTQDDQSNFGLGYEYQFVDENSIDVFMNGKWFRFEYREASNTI